MLDHKRWEKEIDLFRKTYQISTNGFAAQYERRCLPEAGGVLQQPAKLMAALEVIEATVNAMIAEMSKRGRPRSNDKDLGEEPDR